jgi:hypothetical protein
LHVVFVRYDRTEWITREWVYNGAEIDAERIVWVHDLGTERNGRVMNYFKGRRYWLAEPDARPERLTPLLTGQ